MCFLDYNILNKKAIFKKIKSIQLTFRTLQFGKNYLFDFLE
ncbi:hypothetical protein B23_1872 [Geobacillus thermoleovorans B23]|nr:hypothetical protein B23_1872 [Geobacillus thermoleovorans B23]